MNTEDPTQISSKGDPGHSAPLDEVLESRAPLFFSCPDLSQSLDLLCHLTSSSDLIPLVQGERHSGKTTLLYQFQLLGQENWQLCRVDANPMMHPEQLLTQLARTYGVREDVDQVADQLIERLQDLQREGVLPVVVVDDAHLLPLATLAQLMQLHRHVEGGAPLLRVVLFAAPEIKVQLETPEIQALGAQLYKVLQMPAFSLEQTGAFVSFYLNALGQGGTVSFTPDQFQKLHVESLGLPGLIEEWVSKQLHQRGAVSPQVAGPRPQWIRNVPGSWMLGVLSVVLVVVALIFQDEINRLFSDEVDAEHRTMSLELPLEKSSDGPLKSSTLPASVAEQEVPAEVAEEPEPVQPLPVESALEPDLLEPVEQQVAPEPEVSEIVVAVPAPVESAEPEGAVAIIERAPLPVVEETHLELLEPVEAKDSREVEKNVISTKEPVPAVIETDGKLKREPWLRKQNPASYTLQLVGLREESAVIAFVKRHKLEGQVAYFKGSHQGQPWFPVLYGVFPNRAAAVDARSQLPAALGGAGVWPRTFASIQKEIESP
jgi:DamX protein